MKIIRYLTKLFYNQDTSNNGARNMKNVRTNRIYLLQKQSNVSKTSSRNLAQRGYKSTTGMDTQADMCCVGQNFTPYTFTGDECTVSA